jgi:glycosyltransferase involved in cell wall biosynthesis
MKISIDGGSLCSYKDKRFGNYTVTKNLLQALSLYDKVNNYSIYTFCQPAGLPELNNNLKLKQLRPKLGWLKYRISFEEMLHSSNVFLALNQALPVICPKKTIGFSHGLSFYYFPEYYPDSANKMLREVRTMIKQADKIVVSSQKVKDEFIGLFPQTEDKYLVIPFGIPFDMVNKSSVINRNKFFLFVGMNHPVKNVSFIVQSFKQLIVDTNFSDYKLYLVGDFTEYLDKNIIVKKNITRNELKHLYQKATAYITASLYESFNFTVLEALSQNCPVIGLKSAIIPEFIPYVNVAKNKTDFIRLMQTISSTTINIDQLKNKFSWKNYIKKLVDCYD